MSGLSARPSEPGRWIENAIHLGDEIVLEVAENQDYGALLTLTITNRIGDVVTRASAQLDVDLAESFSESVIEAYNELCGRTP